MVAPGFQLPPHWDSQALGPDSSPPRKKSPHTCDGIKSGSLSLTVLHGRRGVYSYHNALSERKFELDMKLWCWGPSRYSLVPD